MANMTRFAVKRLAAVEIEPTVSNQHELNAGALRSGLDFPRQRTQGNLSVLAYTAPDSPAVLLEGSFTLYDARERHPNRSEYRLYYQLPGFASVARPDDLLVLYRDGGSWDLHGALARPGTSMERRLENLLRIGDHEAMRKLVVRGQSPTEAAPAEEWVQTFLPLDTSTDLSRVVRQHQVFADAVSRAMLPPTKTMAEAGADIASRVWGAATSGDEAILRGLEAESGLYFAIEREVGTKGLEDLMREGRVELDKVLSWALGIQQSRKSRRGQSLQHHFAFLLDREGIPYTPQCPTERGETPDFIIPGADAYHDPDYPPQRLRMVACKSTVRERWGQVLKEADRVRIKYLLTLDRGLSDEVVQGMWEKELRAFLPAGLIQENYAAAPCRDLLGTVDHLLGDLRAL